MATAKDGDGMTNIRKIYAAIKARPRTCDETEAATALAHQCVSARIRDLAKRGSITRTWKQRKTRLGGMAWVWRAVK